MLANPIQANTADGHSVFRSRSLMQSYEIDSADTAVAVTGSQNVSFNFGAGQLQQRIDRQFVPSGELGNTF